MNLSTKAVSYHLLSIGAGAWGAMVFAQSGSVDLYALFAQFKKTWGELVVLSGMLAPILAAGLAAYRTFGQKQVPQASIAVVPAPQTPHAESNPADLKGLNVTVAGKVAGCLMAWCFIGALTIHQAKAQPRAFPAPLTQSTCDPLSIFNGITHQNFLARIKQCADDDLDNAIADARRDPIDYAALACLLPVQTMRAAIIKGGLLTGFQGFRRAKAMGLIAGCKNYVTSTVLLP